MKKSIRAAVSKMTAIQEKSSYEKDFCKWTELQARLLRKRELDKIDIDNLIEEIESLGKRDKRSLKSHLIILLQHKLKIEYSPKNHIYAYYINSWNNSVNDAYTEIDLILQDSPSLVPELNKSLAEVYRHAKQKASREMNEKVELFPKDCPWSIKDLFPNIEKKYK